VVTREGRNVRLQIDWHFMPSSQILLRPLRGGSGGDGADSLSLRELAMLYLWDQGLRETDIARQFDVSEASVRQLLHSSRRKLGIHDADEIVAAVRDRIELERPYLPLSGRVCKRPADATALNPTERLVLEGLAGGLTYRQMATRAGKALQTFYSAAYTLRAKLEVDTNAEVLEKALEMGLLELPDTD
jgi:DNA-binding CsgD family transcriptional regulator